MSEQLLDTIITIFGTLLVAAISGVVTWAVANRQDKTSRANKAEELKQKDEQMAQEKAAAVNSAQQQVVQSALNVLQPYKEQNDWLTVQVRELTSRVEQLEERLRVKIAEEARLLKENADLRSAYNVMSRKVQKLERFIRANIGRDIDTDELDSDPSLGVFQDVPPAADPTPPIPTRNTFQDVPNDQPPDDAA